MERTDVLDGAGLHAYRLLAMVGELHRRGLERLRIAPAMAPSGLFWRCTVTPSSNVLRSHGAMTGPDRELTASYTTGSREHYFGWTDVSGASTAMLADLFVERLPLIAASGRGADAAYAAWYVRMLALAEQGCLPIAFADWDLHEDGVHLPLIAYGRPRPVPQLALPPPGQL